MWMHTKSNICTMSSITPTDPWTLPELTRARRAIVVVDVVESVRLMQEDEAGFIDRWRRFVHEVRTEVLPKHGGRMVKSLGDGMLLEFERVPQAVEAAFHAHERIAHPSVGVGRPVSIQLRIGINVSEVVHDELDVYGSGVNLAARIASLAQPGEVVASAALVAELVAGFDCDVEDLGDCFLKHLQDPVHAFRLHKRGNPRASRFESLIGTGTFLPRLAVMPLAVHTDDPSRIPIGELICDSIVARLSVGESLRIVSRLSSSAIARRGLSIGQIASELGVAYVLAGNVAASDGSWLIRLELTETRGESVLLTHEARVLPQDMFYGDDAFSAEVAARVCAAIVTHQLRRTRLQPLPSLEAFTLQLSGTTLMHRAPPLEFARAREVLEALVERHPRAPTPRAWLAKWWVLRTTRGMAPHPKEEAMRALEQTRTALDIDPECTLALAMEGFVQCHMQSDLSAAENSLRTALQMRPSESLAWLFLCVVQGFRGEGEAALHSAETALSLSPLDPMRHYYDALAASAAVAARQPARAIELAQRALLANRNHLPTLRALTVAQAESGDMEGARVTSLRVLELAPQFTVESYLRGAPKGSEATRERYARVFRDVGLP
jgi:adenylate cyclase